MTVEQHHAQKRKNQRPRSYEKTHSAQRSRDGSEKSESRDMKRRRSRSRSKNSGKLSTSREEANKNSQDLPHDPSISSKNMKTLQNEKAEIKLDEPSQPQQFLSSKSHMEELYISAPSIPKISQQEQQIVHTENDAEFFSCTNKDKFLSERTLPLSIEDYSDGPSLPQQCLSSNSHIEQFNISPTLLPQISQQEPQIVQTVNAAEFSFRNNKDEFISEKIPPLSINIQESSSGDTLPAMDNITNPIDDHPVDISHDVNVVSVLTVIKELGHKVGSLGIAIPHLLHQAQEYEDTSKNPLSCLKPEDLALFEMILVKFSSITTAASTSFIEKIIVSEAISQLESLIIALKNFNKANKVNIQEWAVLTCHMNTSDTLRFLKKQLLQVDYIGSLESLYMALQDERRKLIITDVEGKMTFNPQASSEAVSNMKRDKKTVGRAKQVAVNKMHVAFSMSDDETEFIEGSSLLKHASKEMPATARTSEVKKSNLISNLHSQFLNIQPKNPMPSNSVEGKSLQHSGLQLIQQHYNSDLSTAHLLHHHASQKSQK